MKNITNGTTINKGHNRIGRTSYTHGNKGKYICFIYGLIL